MKKICLITGANSGIGKAASISIAKEKISLIMVCRSKKRGEQAREDIIDKTGNKDIDLFIADLSLQEEIKELSKSIEKKYDRIDILINNAGVKKFEREVTQEGIEYTFALDHLGYFLLTHQLLGLLKKSDNARIVNVASRAHRYGKIHFNDINLKSYNPWKAYGQAKLANVLFTYELADRLKDTGITCNCLHPGVVATNFWGETSGLLGFFYNLAIPVLKRFMKTSKKGAETVIYLALSDEVKDVTGKYFADCKIKKSSELSRDKRVAGRLWALSENMCNLTKS